MKNNYLKHLFTALLLLCTTAASAHDFEVDGIYYNILSEEDKTVEVTYKGTSDSEYSNEYTGSVVIPESVTLLKTLTTVIETFDAWTSTNKSDSSTSQKSYTLNVVAGNVLKFDWEVSSETNYDWLVITLDGTEIIKKSGTLSGSYEKTFDTAGSHTLIVKYTKDSSQSRNNDEGEIYNVTLNGLVDVYETVYSVKRIGGYAFFGCTGLTSITIPNSVTSIEWAAFGNCTGLTSVTIPASVTSIEGEAFAFCTNLTNIEIPNSVTTIDSNTFIGTAWYENQPDGVVYAGKLLLTYKGTMPENTSLTIKEGTISIAIQAFFDCSDLTSVTIPNSVTSIGVGAFSVCTGLTSIIIPNSVTSIGSNAFYNCTGLTSVTIGEGVTSIGDYAFYYCSGLTSITIPNSVTSIGGSAFGNCSGLTSITIPNSVTSIGSYAFSNCTGLTSITIPNSVTSIEYGAFYYCTGLTSVTISEGVTSIGGSAFGNCSGLTSITIPNSVTSIGGRAFLGCTGLTSITIPNSVTSIENRAFMHCSSLTCIEIPNSVTSIDEYAFYNCTSLTNITSLISAEKLFAIHTSVFEKVDKTTCTFYVPFGAKETYASTEGWSEFVNIVELEPSELTITINEYGCATYCSPYALDFSNVEGLKAYAATGYKSNSQVVTLTRVQTAEAGIGLFLKGEPGEYVVPVIESTDEHSLNMLVGTLEPTIVNSTSGAMSNYKFTIADGDETPMFYPFEDGTTLSAGKAYLQIPTAWLPATMKKSVSIRFDDGETTGIDEIESESVCEQNSYYDLQGRKVENPTNGIYIINGKKVFIK